MQKIKNITSLKDNNSLERDSSLEEIQTKRPYLVESTKKQAVIAQAETLVE